MIGLDTNVLVRYLVQDDRAQAARATRLIERELSERRPGYIGLVVLVEMCWVLQRLYAVNAVEIEETIRDLLAARQLVVADRAVVNAALARCSANGGDFADALIDACARAAGCDQVVTFDATAAKVGMTRLR